MKTCSIIYLIANLITISCAPALGSVHYSNDTIDISSSLPTSPLAFGKFNIIDEDNPPTSGLWLSWGDAESYALHLQDERYQWQKIILQSRRDYELERVRHQITQKELDEFNSSESKFWMTWGFPIGIGAGLIVGAFTSFAILSTKR